MKQLYDEVNSNSKVSSAFSAVNGHVATVKVGDATAEKYAKVHDLGEAVLTKFGLTASSDHLSAASGSVTVVIKYKDDSVATYTITVK